MTVNINIDVNDPSGLLRINQTQVAANRAAQQEKNSKKEVEKKATPLRQEALESRQDNSNKKNRLEPVLPTPKIREPAANRFDKGLLVAHGWLFQDSPVYLEGTQDVLFTDGVVLVDRPALIQEQFSWQLGSGNGLYWVNDIHEKESIDFFNNFEILDFLGTGNFTNRYRASMFRSRPSHRFYRDLILPCGDGSFIIIFINDSVLETFTEVGEYSEIERDAGVVDYIVSSAIITSNQGVESVEQDAFHERHYRTFVCSNTGLREIELPPQMQDMIESDLIPLPTLVETEVNYRRPGYISFSNIYYTQKSYTFSPDFGAAGSVRTPLGQSSGGPLIFNSIQEAASGSFESPIANKVFPYTNWEISDIRDGAGGWSRFDVNGDLKPEYELDADVYNQRTLERIYNEENQLKYGTTSSKNYPQLATWFPPGPIPRSSPQNTLRLSPDRVQKQGTPLYGYDSYWTEDILIVDNGGLREECRRACLALGFPASDLRP